MKTKIQTLKGFRDFLPATMRVRNYCLNTFKQVFESFGFEPLETPTLEYASTLTGKYGTEANKLIYTFTDKGGRKVGLRYDLTVPTSKVLAMYQNKIPLPFKRYQIQPVWRADKPQKGRYREFIQSDFDCFGSTSPTTDAEIIAITYYCLKNIGFKQFKININSRQILDSLLNLAGITSNKDSILQSLDKITKIGQDAVISELISKNITKAKAENILKLIKLAKPDQNLSQVLESVSSFGVPKDFFSFDPTLVRGLDYYTGTIFETTVTKPKIGSISGGGRFDNLISTLGGPNIPAVGSSLGLDRIVDCIIDQNLLPNLTQSSTQVLVSLFNQDLIDKSIKITTQLIDCGINTFLYPTPDKLSKQFKFASDKKIPYVVIIGPDEIKNNTITLKNMSTGLQQNLKQKALLDLFKNLI